MSIAEIHQLPIEEKLRLMEALWEDLRDRFEQMSIPPTQQALLDERRARVQNDGAKLLDWDAVKGTIGRG
jgi:putative addiction module component (TIGR02574 family)